MKIFGDRFISFLVASKIGKDEYEHFEEANGVSPCCLRAWWFWLPTVRMTNIGVDIFWLCFGITYDDFNKITRKRYEDL